MLYTYSIKIYYTHVIRDLRDNMFATHYEFVDYSFLVGSYMYITGKLESINMKQL